MGGLCFYGAVGGVGVAKGAGSSYWTGAGWRGRGREGVRSGATLVALMKTIETHQLAVAFAVAIGLVNSTHWMANTQIHRTKSGKQKAESGEHNTTTQIGVDRNRGMRRCVCTEINRIAREPWHPLAWKNAHFGFKN